MNNQIKKSLDIELDGVPVNKLQEYPTIDPFKDAQGMEYEPPITKWDKFNSIYENQENNKEGGFEPIPEYEKWKPCLNPEHTPPTHLYIPPGQQYRHICPGCGFEVVIRPIQVTC